MSVYLWIVTVEGSGDRIIAASSNPVYLENRMNEMMIRENGVVLNFVKSEVHQNIEAIKRYHPNRCKPGFEEEVARYIEQRFLIERGSTSHVRAYKSTSWTRGIETWRIQAETLLGKEKEIEPVVCGNRGQPLGE